MDALWGVNLNFKLTRNVWQPDSVGLGVVSPGPVYYYGLELRVRHGVFKSASQSEAPLGLPLGRRRIDY